MAKSPDKPHRDPAKHSKKDPAKPTRAKASRPDFSPLDPSLAELLNPAIGQGRAGVGSQTGIEDKEGLASLPPCGGGRGGGSGGDVASIDDFTTPLNASPSPPDPHP